MNKKIHFLIHQDHTGIFSLQNVNKKCKAKLNLITNTDRVTHNINKVSGALQESKRNIFFTHLSAMTSFLSYRGIMFFILFELFGNNVSVSSCQDEHYESDYDKKKLITNRKLLILRIALLNYFNILCSSKTKPYAKKYV